MKANTLKEAINCLDPEHPLTEPQELENFYVERPLSPLKKLSVFLEDSRAPQKILFMGHRGSGKSTELAKLTIALQNNYFIIHCSAKKHLNLFDLNYADVALSIALELLHKVVEQQIPVSPEALTIIEDFTKQITLEIQNGEGKSKEGTVEGKANLGIFIPKLAGKYKTETETRISIRKTLGHRFKELLDNIELLAEEIKRITQKPVLVIVEDLDKTSVKTAKELFFENAPYLLSPRVSIIYTFPIEMRFDHDYQHILNNFTYSEVLPNLKTHFRDGNPSPEGIAALREILIKRMDPSLINPEGLRLLIANSSGIPRELIALSRLASLEARVLELEVIDEKAVKLAIANRRRDYQVQLNSEQIKQLQEVQRTKWLENEEKNMPLLKNLSALEYRNADVWYDVHPLIEPLLREKE